MEGEGGSFTAPAWTQDTLSGSAEAGYTLTLPEQTKYKFNGTAAGSKASPIATATRRRSATANPVRLETITDPAAVKSRSTYNAEGLVESAKDPMGHTVKYAYEAKNLKSVTHRRKKPRAGNSNTTVRTRSPK